MSPHMTTYLKGYVNLSVEGPHGMLAPGHILWPLVWCEWRYKVFKLSCDLINNVIERSCNLMSESSSLYVTTLPSVVTIGIVLVET